MSDDGQIFTCRDWESDELVVEEYGGGDGRAAVFVHASTRYGVYLTAEQVAELVEKLRTYTSTEVDAADLQFTAELLQKKYNETVILLNVERRRVSDLENKLVDLRQDVKREFGAQLERRFNQLRRSLDYVEDGNCPGCRSCQE